MSRLRRILDLWPLTIVAIGFILLGIATWVAQTAPLWISPVFWVIFPFVIAGGIFAWITQWHASSSTFLASTVLSFATVRIIDFWVVDRFPGMAVWLIVIGLTITVWRQQLERHGLGR